MKESALNQILGRIKAREGQSQPEVDVQALNAQARDDLDRFFTQEILPRLTALHKAGRLPNLALDSLWARVEALWQTAAKDYPPCDVEAVKTAMIRAVESYEKSETQGEL